MLVKMVELFCSVMIRVVSHYVIILIDIWLDYRKRKQEQSDSKDDK